MTAISSDSMRGFNDLIILTIIAKHDTYGYEISQQISYLSQGQYQLKETTLYSALARLEKNGWVESYQGDITFGKKRTYYHITKDGQLELANKIDEWKHIQTIINQFIGKDFT